MLWKNIVTATIQYYAKVFIDLRTFEGNIHAKAETTSSRR